MRVLRYSNRNETMVVVQRRWQPVELVIRDEKAKGTESRSAKRFIGERATNR